MKYEKFNDFLSSLGSSNDVIISKTKKLREENEVLFFKENIVILIFDAILLFIMKTISIYTILAVIILDIFIFVINTILKGNKTTIQVNKEYKEKVVNKLLENFVDELDYVPLKGMPRNIFNETEYRGTYSIYHSEDYYEGKIKGQDIMMADVVAEDEVKEKNKDGEEETRIVTVFSGVFGKVNLSKSINSNLIITRGTGYKMLKLQMDSYEFEKAFNVYASNKIVGMQLLTADIQEDILDLFKKYKVNFQISIKDDVMYVFFDTYDMFEFYYNKKNPNEALEKYFNVMKFINRLIDKILTTIDTTPV